jgi:type I restriction enzyme, S subunit
MMKEVELGNVCHFENGDRGKNYPSQSAFVEIGIPFISAKDLKNNLIKHDNLNYISEETYNKLGSGKLQPNDILFCLRGSLGKFAINKDCLKGGIASSLVLLRAKEDLQINYLKHYLNSPRMKRLITKSDNGSSQPNLSGANVKKFPIPLPPIDQQKKIAAILDAADAFRQKTRALIEKYDELTQSLFLDMFGDPVTNPKGWEVNFLKQITTKIGSGATPRGGKQAYKKEGISLIRSMNVYDNRFKYKNLAFIDEDQAAKLKNVIVEKGDVLFNITGASICRSSVVPDDVLPARVNQHVSILRPIKSIITSKFLSRFLISENVKTKLLGVGSGGGAVMEAITKEQLQSIEVIKPPLELQNEFSKRVQLIEAQKAQAQASLVKAEDLFNSLLQRAFKGELIN